MIQVFADTSFYQALLNPGDTWRTNALRFSEEYTDTIVTTEHVLTELGALMSRGYLRNLYIEFIDGIRQDPLTIIVEASGRHFDQGFNLFRNRIDKDWSMTDCISFTVMDQLNIHDAVTCDKHFEQAGFRNMLLV